MTMADLRYAFRTFVRSPWFTLVSLTMLALGIGVNSALFSVVKSVLVEDLPYRKPNQLVRVWVSNPKQGFDHDVTSMPRLEDWRARSRLFEDFAAFFGSRLAWTGGQEPQQLRGAATTANFFSVMGATTVLGRTFERGEDQPGRPRVVVLSAGFWRRSFGADPTVIGRQLTLSGRSYTVVGVLPPSFQFPMNDLDFWTPLAVDDGLRQNRGIFWLNVVGRLRDGVTLPQAQAEMDAIARALQKEYPIDRNLGVALVGLQNDLTAPLRPALLVLMGAVVLVLLICCANIAGMLTARAANRQRELSIRAALGAGRSRVVRQLLTESMVLFLAGGILGIAVARLCVMALLRLAPPELPQLQSTHLDFAMVAFTLAVSAASGLIFGLRPAFGASRSDLVESLKGGGRNLAGRMNSQRFRRVLMIGEMALAMVLLTGAGLLIRSLQRIGQSPLGFDTRGVSLAQIDLPQTKYPQAAQAARFWQGLVAGLRSTPGIESAAVVSSMLLDRLPNSNVFKIEGRPETIYTPLTTDSVSPEFFSVMKIRLLRGRFFTPDDRADSLPVAIINATTANRYWPNTDPIGKRFTFNLGSAPSWLTIAGVVADTGRAGVDRPVFTESYYPVAQSPGFRMEVVMRADGGVAAAKTALQATLRGLDRDQPVTRFGTLDAAMGARIASRRFTTVLMSLFATAALAMAAVGLYGLIAYLVSQRQREFGVRLALGAQPRDLLRLIVRQVSAMAAVGVGLGLLGALLLSRALDSLLFGIGRFDPASYALAGCELLCICLTAGLLPAIHALRVDPVSTLRAE